MGGFSFRSLTFMLIVAFLLWFSNIESCNARRGKHWRRSGSISASLLSKKKAKANHNSHHHQGQNGSNTKSKQKSPPPSSKPEPKSPNPSSGGKPGGVISPPIGDSEGVSDVIYNVLDFGANGDGVSDDTKAFEAAWAAACEVEASTLLVPLDYTFLVGPVSFSGPYCQRNIVFQLDGTMIAPTNANAWSSGLYQWLLFSKLVGITITGSGTLDGRGSVWWQNSSPYDDPIDDEYKLIIPINKTTLQHPSIPISSPSAQQLPSLKPTALRFYGSLNVTVRGITIQNSMQCHLKFDNCIGVSVYNFTVTSPGDSPNTDGIHLQNSKDVLIRSSNLACGDDCVSIQTGCSNVYIHNVNCGPGHGISIGSLGKDNTKACVSNITVRDIIMQNTINGVRIKTWQGGSGSVQGVSFSNIQMSEVQFPIVIDQFYCDKRVCKNQTSAVALVGIDYSNIRGTYTVKPVHFACSDSRPCSGITLAGIQLKPLQERYHLYDPFCWQTFGELFSPPEPPIESLQVGKPSSNQVQIDLDSC